MSYLTGVNWWKERLNQKKKKKTINQKNLENHKNHTHAKCICVSCQSVFSFFFLDFFQTVYYLLYIAYLNLMLLISAEFHLLYINIYIIYFLLLRCYPFFLQKNCCLFSLQQLSQLSDLFIFVACFYRLIFWQ